MQIQTESSKLQVVMSVRRGLCGRGSPNEKVRTVSNIHLERILGHYWHSSILDGSIH